MYGPESDSSDGFDRSSIPSRASFSRKQNKGNVKKFRLLPGLENQSKIKIFLRRKDAMDFFEKMQIMALFSRAVTQQHKVMFLAHQCKIIARYGTRERIEALLQRQKGELGKIVKPTSEKDAAPEYVEAANYLIYDRQNTKTFVMTCFSEKQHYDYMLILKIHCRSFSVSNPITQQVRLKKAFADLGIKKDPSNKEVREHFRIMIETQPGTQTTSDMFCFSVHNKTIVSYQTDLAPNESNVMRNVVGLKFLKVMDMAY